MRSKTCLKTCRRKFPLPATHATAANKGKERGLSILVAEDNEINALLARALLTRLGHRPTVAGNGAAAVESWAAARAAGNPYDLVLMDVQMPGMDGLQAARRIRATEAAAGDRPVRMLALTANAQTEDRDACLAAGMDGLLVKPLDAAVSWASTISASASPICGDVSVSLPVPSIFAAIASALPAMAKNVTTAA